MESTHRVNVVRIAEILPHPNADRLDIIPIGGYQVVSGKGQFKVGDLAVYIQPDSVLPEKKIYSFVWERDGGGNIRPPFDGPVPEKYRRVTVRRLRKEWSEGLLMPLAEVCNPDMYGAAFNPEEFVLPQEGDDVAELLGITHYNPPEPDEIQNGVSVKQSKVWPRSLKGWFYFLSYWLSFGLYDPWGDLGGGNEKAPENTPPIYDVEAYKNYSNVLVPGEEVFITEKVHGSNFRAVFIGGKFYVGSWKLWKKAKSANIWRRAAEKNPDIEKWCRDNPGCVLYGEVVPTQKGFDYGATAEEPKVFLFDVRNEDGTWVPKPDALGMTSGYDLFWAPLIGLVEWDSSILSYADGPTYAGGASHIREGIVICTVPDRYVRGAGRCQLKVISAAYYEKQKE